MLWFFFNLSTIYLLLFPSIFFHELGHALTGRLLNIRIFSLTVGRGRTVFEKKISGVSVTLKSTPRSGNTFGLPLSLNYFKTRMWFFVLGGPLTHILWVIIFYYLLGRDQFLETIAPRSFFLGFAPISVFLYINAFNFVRNIIPGKVIYSDRQNQTDGYKLFSIPFKKKEVIKTDLNIYFETVKAEKLYKEEKFSEAKAIYYQMMEKLPNNLAIMLQIGYIELLEGNIGDSKDIYIRALSKIETEFSDDPKFSQIKNMLYNNIAWVDVITENPDLIEQADEYSKKALASSSNYLVFQGTRGAVLIRKGEVAEGLILVQKSFDQQKDKLAKSSEALFLAMGEAKNGNESQSLEWLETARAIHSENYLIEMIEKEVLQINAKFKMAERKGEKIL